MAYTRQYTEGVGWQNSPSLATPLNATNLNKMDDGIKNVDEAVAEEFESVEQALSNLEDDAVTDVMVGGTSVVSGGVAEIPAIPSVPVQDVQVDDVSIVDGNGIAKLDSSDFGTPVEANPTGTASADLTKLKVGNDIYNIPSGGGGTTVVANPSGTATDDLEKIQIGSTVYNIPSGGGGSVYMSDYYSTEERVVGRWIDGKPLYQKTFDIGALTKDSSFHDVAHNISNIDKVAFVEGTAYESNGAAHPLSDYRAGQSYGITVGANLTNIFYVNNWLTVIDCTVTLCYTKTTDAPGTGPTAGNIIYLPALYSEEEREVGVFTDGKPLYQKTIDIGYLPSNSTKNVNHDIANIDKIVTVFGFAKDSTSAIDKTIPLPYANASSAGNQVQLEVYNTYIQVATKITAFSTYYGKITIQYTKTTDTPGSGTWTPDGQLSHHYSTSEHIVGTWIDGSTIYERTWDLGSDVSLTANNWYDTSISNSGISLLTNVEAISANGNFRGQIEGNVNSSGSYIQLRSDGIASSVRYATLRYTKS